jgi:hypothetical protein
MHDRFSPIGFLIKSEQDLMELVKQTEDHVVLKNTTFSGIIPNIRPWPENRG